MKKEKRIKYIVTGTANYCFITQSFRIYTNKNKNIESGNQGTYKVTIDNKNFTGKVVQKKQNKIAVQVNGNTYDFSIDSEKAFNRKKKFSKKKDEKEVSLLKSPMPGKICEVFVTKGDEVKKGEPLLILEAMKMQNQVLASFDCKVVEIHAKVNDTVMGGQLLLELKK